jgi:hypothetical protein
MAQLVGAVGNAEHCAIDYMYSSKTGQLQRGPLSKHEQWAPNQPERRLTGKVLSQASSSACCSCFLQQAHWAERERERERERANKEQQPKNIRCISCTRSLGHTPLLEQILGCPMQLLCTFLLMPLTALSAGVPGSQSTAGAALWLPRSILEQTVLLLAWRGSPNADSRSVQPQARSIPWADNRVLGSAAQQQQQARRQQQQ